MTGWDLSFVEEKIAAVFDFSLYDAGVRLLRTAWDGMLSIVGPMVASIQAKLAAIMPDWLRSAVDWAIGGSAASTPEGAPPGRALGGAVRAGQVYRWMEEGEERFIPRVDGDVISNRELRALRAAGGRRGGTTVNVGSIVIHATPGQSPQEISREVLREMERRAGRGSELHNGGAYAF